MASTVDQRSKTFGVPVGGFNELAARLGSGTVAASWLTDRLDFIDSRADMADHRLAVVLKLLLAGDGMLTDNQVRRIDQTILGFRYWMDEPGQDSMVHWSESHQLLFGVCEYLAGQRHPDHRFSNDLRLGSAKLKRARARLLEWLGNRFHLGFSEWLSPIYYSFDVAGLTLLVDHCDDDELRTRASMVLDLLLFDMALHQFQGSFIASAGRCDTSHKARPDTADNRAILASAFGGEHRVNPDRLSSLFVDRSRYVVPAVLGEIANANGPHRIRLSHGLDVSEVSGEIARRLDLTAQERNDAAVRLLWGMEAFTNPEFLGPTLRAIREMSLSKHALLAPLAKFSVMRRTRGARMTVSALNPVTAGKALQRADVQTYRTPGYLLSSVQRHRPGRFGDQQHLWHAALPGNIAVFATHPGSTMLGGPQLPGTPNAWVGNGINPDIAQHDNVLLSLHDTRARRGYLEGRRHQFSHLYFPFALFDRTEFRGRVLAGRRGDIMIGIVGLNRLDMESESEVLQRGRVTGWAVMLTDRSEFSSLKRFLDHLTMWRLYYRGEALEWSTAMHQYELYWNGPFEVDGEKQHTAYPRYDTPWAQVPRRPETVTISGSSADLHLNWPDGTRAEADPGPLPGGR